MSVKQADQSAAQQARFPSEDPQHKATDLIAHVVAEVRVAAKQQGMTVHLASDGQVEDETMLVTGRRSAILRDSSAPTLPTNLTAQIYKSVDFAQLATIKAAAHHWLIREYTFTVQGDR